MSSGGPRTGAAQEPALAVLAPSPILTVTLERDDGAPELHLHPGGQAFWVARMIAELGADAVFCAPLGGEVGAVLRSLLEDERLELRAIDATGCNGAYIHERRSGGELVEIGSVASPGLTRHEADALYAETLSASLATGSGMLTGPAGEGILAPDFYRRLAGDLRRNGCSVLADLSGPSLAAALEGGVDLLHISERELGDHLGEVPRCTEEMVDAVRRLREQGAELPIVSRAERPALALVGDEVHELIGPVFEAHEPRGAGDSMFATIATSLARGEATEAALRMGVAAGALNVVRRGLGSGGRGAIEELARAVELRPLG